MKRFLFLLGFVYSCQNKDAERSDRKEDITVFNSEEKIEFKNQEARRFFNEARKLSDINPLKAQELYSKALNQDPENPYILNEYSIVNRVLGDTIRAEIALLEAFKVDSSHMPTYVNYTLLHITSQYREKAIKLGNKGLKRFPETYHKGLLYFNMACLYYNVDSCSIVKRYLKRSKELLGKDFPKNGYDFKKEVEKFCP